MKKSEIYRIISEQSENKPALEWFGTLSDDAKPSEKRLAATRTGTALSAFQNRIFDGVRLVIDTSIQKTQQWRYKFTREI
jgi:hypothetical protein